jgi:hypothetical protein
MRELRSRTVGDRRVTLIEHEDGSYAVTIAVRGPLQDWEDISLRADRGLTLEVASRRYRQRLADQQARMLGLKV